MTNKFFPLPAVLFCNFVTDLCLVLYISTVYRIDNGKRITYGKETFKILQYHAFCTIVIMQDQKTSRTITKKLKQATKTQ